MLCFISREDLEFWQLSVEFRNYGSWALCTVLSIKHNFTYQIVLVVV